MTFDDMCNLALFGSLDDLAAALDQAPELATATGSYDFTVLHTVMTEERPEVVRLLIERGADVHARNDTGDTPLHIAQDPDVVSVLVEAGAALDARNSHDQTPLIVQAAEGYDTGSLGTMARLLELGADPNARDRSGATAWSIAQRRRERAKLDLLKRHGATEAGD